MRKPKVFFGVFRGYKMGPLAENTLLFSDIIEKHALMEFNKQIS